tara:strand:- start:21346 stop:22902 length:1557 start_codon:yes stop_codon:yes gene_type:complete
MALSPALGPNLEPAQNKMALAQNYLSFNQGENDFAQQYLPELYEQEVERYGNRTLSGFLRMVGAEMPMTSDQVIWSEQNRLHVSYEICEVLDDDTIIVQIDPDTSTNGGVVPATKECAIKVNQTLVVFGTSAAGAGQTMKVLVTAVGAAYGGGSAGAGRFAEITVAPYTAAGLTTASGGIFTGTGSTAAANSGVSIFVYGAEWQKGSDDSGLSSIEPEFTQYANSPIIIRDVFEINGSDTAQIGWVEVITEDGTSGYLWYLKSESETRLRFDDYLEMSMVEGELATSGSAVEGRSLWSDPATVSSYGGRKGTQGLFAAIKERGHEYQDFAGTGGGNAALTEFDEILAQLDFEGAIEENMIFCNRSLALAIDNMMANVNGSAQNSNDGASYGLFDNDSSMALNFGFNGFRRGSYDFYKTDWKYLNDASTRGLATDIEGVLIPAGTSTVYDQMLGSNIRRPFLHVRYRASEADDRRYKNWVTGSVGGAYTSGVDAMRVHFLSERCLVTQAANNFMLFTNS